MVFSGIKPKFMTFLGILIFSGLLPFSTSHALEIMVRERATVRGDMIRLEDIASFDPMDDGRISRLSRIVISSAPSPGSRFRLNERLLINKIGSYIANENDIKVKIPENLLIKRTAQFISPLKLEEIFKEYVRNSSQWPADKIEFKRISTPGNIALPEGSLKWNIGEKGSNRKSGNIALVIDFSVNGRQIRKVPVSGRISISQEFVKAARKIRRGVLITKDDLTLATESQADLRNDTLTRLNEAIGKRAARSIQAGQVMTFRMIETPPLVKKGNRVIIKAENEKIRITTHGKVLEDGRAGDQIRVINIRSGKEIYAKVKGPGLVEVTF